MKKTNALLNEKILSVQKAIGQLNIPKENIHSSGTRLQALYNEKSKKKKLIGYEAKKEYTLTTQKLNSLSPILSVLLKAGINDVDGIDFLCSKEKEFELKGLKEAAKDAQDKASLLATSLGAKLGRVLSIRVESYYEDDEDDFAEEEDSSTLSSSSISEGMVHFNTTVHVTFELEGK